MFNRSFKIKIEEKLNNIFLIFIQYNFIYDVNTHITYCIEREKERKYMRIQQIRINVLNNLYIDKSSFTNII